MWSERTRLGGGASHETPCYLGHCSLALRHCWRHSPVWLCSVSLNVRAGPKRSEVLLDHASGASVEGERDPRTASNCWSRNSRHLGRDCLYLAGRAGEVHYNGWLRQSVHCQPCQTFGNVRLSFVSGFAFFPWHTGRTSPGWVQSAGRLQASCFWPPPRLYLSPIERTKLKSQCHPILSSLLNRLPISYWFINSA